MVNVPSFFALGGQQTFDLGSVAKRVRVGSTRQRVLGLGLGTILALAVGACASDRGTDAKQAQAAKAKQSNVAATKREAELNAAWRGHRYEELLEQFGEPVSKMNMIGQRSAMTTLVLFGVDAKTKCVDAFTMNRDEKTGQWSVADYFCR